MNEKIKCSIYSSSVESSSTTKMRFVGDSSLNASSEEVDHLRLPQTSWYVSGKSLNFLLFAKIDSSLSNQRVKQRELNFKSETLNFFHCRCDLYPKTYRMRNTKVSARLYGHTRQKCFLDLSAIAPNGVGFASMKSMIAFPRML